MHGPSLSSVPTVQQSTICPIWAAVPLLPFPSLHLSADLGLGDLRLMGAPHRRDLSPFPDKQACGSPSPLPPVGSASCFRAPGPTESSGPSFHLAFLPPQTQPSSAPSQPHLRSAGAAAGAQSMGGKVQQALHDRARNYLPIQPSQGRLSATFPRGPAWSPSCRGRECRGLSRVSCPLSGQSQPTVGAQQTAVDGTPPAHTWNSPAAHGSARGPGRPGPFS